MTEDEKAADEAARVWLSKGGGPPLTEDELRAAEEAARTWIEKRVGLALCLRAITEVRAMRSVLRSVEWGGSVVYGNDGDGAADVSSACPACGSERMEGHDRDCKLAAALR